MAAWKNFLKEITKEGKVDVTVDKVIHDGEETVIYLDYGGRQFVVCFKGDITVQITFVLKGIVIEDEDAMLVDEVINELNTDAYLYYYNRYDSVVSVNSFSLTDENAEAAITIFYYLSLSDTIEDIYGKLITLLEMKQM